MSLQVAEQTGVESMRGTWRRGEGQVLRKAARKIDKEKEGSDVCNDGVI